MSNSNLINEHACHSISYSNSYSYEPGSRYHPLLKHSIALSAPQSRELQVNSPGLPNNNKPRKPNSQHQYAVKTTNKMADNNKRELKLSTSKDWNAWLSIVKAKAHGHDVWNLVDPSSITKPPNQPVKPIEPDLDAQQGTDFTEKHARYKVEMGKYKQLYKEYEKQKEGLVKVTDLILATISVANITYIQKVKVHPWDQLVALKARLAPTNAARSFELEQQYHRLAKGPSNRQNIDQWLDEYMKMYTLGKKASIAECTDERRVYRDFLLSIEKMAPTFAEMRQILAPAIPDHHAVLIIAIDDFRQHMRLKEAQKGKGASHSAFAADDVSKPSFKGKTQASRPCVCDLLH